MLWKRGDEAAMLNGGHCNCGSSKQDEQETKDARRKGSGSRCATGRLEGNKVKEETEP
jgi:hypothetical protein